MSKYSTIYCTLFVTQFGGNYEVTALTVHLLETMNFCGTTVCSKGINAKKLANFINFCQIQLSIVNYYYFCKLYSGQTLSCTLLQSRRHFIF